MRFWWIIGRAVLLSLFGFFFVSLFLSLLNHDWEQGIQINDIATFVFIALVAVILALAIYNLEVKYSESHKWIDTKKFFLFEIFVALLAVVVLHVVTNTDMWSQFSNKNTLVSAIAVIILYGLVGFLPLLKKRKSAVPLTQKEIANWSINFNDQIKKINEKYDTKSGSLIFQTKYKNCGLFQNIIPWRQTRKNIKVSLEFELSRSISSMSHKERESCRILELLELYGLQRYTSQNLLAPMVWANGKGTINNYKGWRLYKKNYNQSTRKFDSNSLADSITVAVEWFIKNIAMYHNFDSAVSRLLEIVNQISNETPNHPLIIEIQNRLKSGNAWLDGGFDGSGFAKQQPSKDGIFLGDMPDGNECWFTGQGALITIAPPGSGKTQTHIIPNLLKWKGPAVVLDVKGELWDKTAGYRAKHVGKVYRFAPLDPDHSHHFNPLLLVRNDEDYLWEDAKFLADMIIVKGESKDPFWENKARELITAAIAVECMSRKPEHRSMATVIAYCYGVDWNGLRNKMLESPIKTMQNVITSLISMEADSGKTLEGIRQQAQSYLSIWEGAKVERSLKESDWHPDALRSDNITIYIGLKAGEIDTYANLLKVFVAQHIRTLIQDLPKETAPDILFMLDEFPRLKFMAEIEEALEIGRQFKIKLFLAVQSIGQVKQHYKNADGLIGSCAIRAYMNPASHDGTAEKISKELGYIQSVVDGTRVNIAESTDLTGEEYKNDVIILASGSKPIRANKSFAYQDTQLTQKMDIPPPQIKRSAVGRLIEP